MAVIPPLPRPKLIASDCYEKGFQPSVSCIKQNASPLNAHVYTMASILLDLKFQAGIRLF